MSSIESEIPETKSSQHELERPVFESVDGFDKPQLFLGGSCNPTTWRRDIAAPFLKSKEISFYNPQVENWSPDLVEIERKAKESATILLFVIDRQTRSTVSIVESAYMAGINRHLVLAMVPFEESYESSSESNELIDNSRQHLYSLPIRICNETLSQLELLELCQARQLLQCLVSLRNIPIFLDIKEALEYIHRYLTKEFKLSPFAHNKIQHMPTNRKSKTIYVSFDDLYDKNLGATVSKYLQSANLECKTLTLSNILPAKIEEDKLSSKTFSELGLTCLRANLMEYMSAVSSSGIALFMITGQSRGLSIMLLASHFMALFPQQVILLLQDLKADCEIEGESLTKFAIADYNRGRVYLRDYANEAQIPVFQHIDDSMDCCIMRMRD